jgi:hypothetical protein
MVEKKEEEKQNKKEVNPHQEATKPITSSSSTTLGFNTG